MDFKLFITKTKIFHIISFFLNCSHLYNFKLQTIYCTTKTLQVLQKWPGA